MRISGFTFVRNGTLYDYPFIESIRSLLPWVDELIVNVGESDDDTLDRVSHIAKSEEGAKIRFFLSRWPLDDVGKKQGGRILSEQTNLALERCNGEWCIYLQADEILNGEDLPLFMNTLKRASLDPLIDGLLFDYVHFYGSFDVVQTSRGAYRREIRAIRKSSNARSIGDAQSFRKQDGTKLRVVRSGASIFHYGWVRSPEAMQQKTFFMDQLYHGAPSTKNSRAMRPHTGDNYRYKKFWGLRSYSGPHPEVMRERINAKGWKWDLHRSPYEWKWTDVKKIFLDLIERATGHRFFEYKNYQLIE